MNQTEVNCRNIRIKSKRFLCCFKPLDMVKDNAGHNNPSAKCPGHKDTLAFVAIDDGEVLLSCPESEGKTKGGSRRFARALKSVFYEISHGKLHRKRKQKSQGEKESKTESKVNKDVLLYQNGWSEDDEKRIDSSATASSSSSSTLSSSTLTSRSSSERKDAFNLKPVVCRQKSKSWWSLILLSLFALIFYGKVFAIICASTWLLFVPKWNARSGMANVDLSSDKYKKKIILEGLLGRDRSHASFTAIQSC